MRECFFANNVVIVDVGVWLRGAPKTVARMDEWLSYAIFSSEHSLLIKNRLAGHAAVAS